MNTPESVMECRARVLKCRIERMLARMRNDERLTHRAFVQIVCDTLDIDDWELSVLYDTTTWQDYCSRRGS